MYNLLLSLMRKKRQLGKKGQVTIFIIVGIVILGIVLGMVYVSQYLVKEELKVIEEEAGELFMTTSLVKMFVENCLERVGEEGIFYLGWQGGYYQADYRHVDFSSVLVPYFYYLDNYYLPDKEVVAEELSSYIMDNLDKCINNFEVYKERGAVISEDNLVVKSEIVPGKILIEAEYPIKIKRAGAAIALDRFLAEVELDFNEIYNQVSLSLEEQKEAPNAIPLGGITHLAYLNDFSFEVDNLADDSVLYFFLFDNTIREEPYVFIYAAKYDWSEEFREDEEIPPVIEEESLAGQEEILVEHYKEQSIDLFVGIAEEEIIIPEETDYNSLSTEDLVAALENGEVADLTVITDANFIPALNNNPALLGREEVLGDFNRRIGTDISLINNNIQIKERWFTGYKITDQGVELAWYVKGTIETKGEDATGFEVDKYPGAIVEKEGGLILPDGAKVGGCAIVKEGDIIEIIKIVPEGRIVPESRLDLKNLIKTTKSAYHVLGMVDVLLEENRFLVSEKTVLVEIKDGMPVISGEEVLIKSSKPKKIVGSFTGEIVYHSEHHITWGKRTSFKNYLSGANFEVDKETEYYAQEGGCLLEFEKSCVEYAHKKRDLTIGVQNDNKIKLKLVNLIRESVNNLKIETISDGSVVEVNDNLKVKYVFSKEPVKVYGQPITQSVGSIKYSFVEEEEKHTQEIKAGYIVECSLCRKVGKLRSEAINRNPKEILDFVATWAIRAAQDPRYTAEWGGKGEVIYPVTGNYVPGDRKFMTPWQYYQYVRKLKEETDDPLFKEELGTSPVNRRTVAVFSCIGFVQAAYDTATGRSVKLGTEKFIRYNRGHLLHEQFRDEFSFKTEFHVIEGNRIPPIIQKGIDGGEIKLIQHKDALERAEVMKDIPIGAPMAQYARKPIVGTRRWERHEFLKGPGKGTIEAHTSLDVSVDEGTLETKYGNDVNLLVSYP
jgi:hypothetical protein